MKDNIAPEESPRPPAQQAGGSRLLARLPMPLLRLPYRYGIGCLIVAAAAAVRLAFMQSLGTRTPYLTFYPAVMLAALYGGLWAGLVATALSACLADLLWIEPAGSFWMRDPADWLSMAVFLLSCAMISWTTEAMQRAQARAREAEAKVNVPGLPQEVEEALQAGGARSAKERLKAIFPVKAVFGVALAILVAVAWAAYRNITSMVEANQRENHTRLVIRGLDRLLSTLKDAETGQRGFLITGQESYLGPYIEAVGLLDEEMASLKVLARDDPGRLKWLQEIEAVVSDKLSELKQTIELRRAKGFEAARQVVMADVGRAGMDDARKRVGAFEAEEERLLQERTKARIIDTRSLLQTGVVGGLMGFALLLLVFRLLRGEIVQRVRVEGEVKVHRDNLKALVKARTAELEAQVAERRRAEEALRESRERLSLALASSDMAAFDWDILKNRRTWDPEVHRLLGTNPETFTGKQEEFFRIMPPEDRSAVREALSTAVEKTGVYETEYRAIWPDGTIRHIAARGKVHRDSAGHAVRLTGVCWDITEDRRKERELRRLNRTLNALGHSSRAMTRAAREGDYLEEVCKIIVQDCGHAMVWIGFAEGDEGRTVRPVAYAGFEQGYIETLNVTWADTERGCGPTGSAIRTGKPSVCRQMLTDPAFSPWREEALKRGYASSLALPLITEGNSFGALTLYATEPDAFSEDEVRLLTQLADDLAYGVATIRLRLARARYQQERDLTIEFLRLVNASTGTRDLVRTAATFFQQQSDCQAVGVRLKEGDDYPYFEARGFPRAFVLAEDSLCARDSAGRVERDGAGYPVCECMCGNVICGRTDPGKPFFTAGGSFWTNSTTALLATTTEADRQARTRNRCNGEGYESVALVPLRVGTQRLGLLQLNDRRKGLFSAEAIVFWERLACYLAVALAKTRAEDALRESQRDKEMMATILALSSQPFGMGYPDGRLGLVNTAFERLTGYTAEELRGMDWATALTPPEWRELERKELEKLRSTGQPVRYEKEYVRKDGSRVPIELLVHLMTDSEGKPQYYYSFLTDIGERKRAEEAVRAQAALLDLAHDAIFVRGAQNRITFWNQGAEQTYGWTRAEVMGLDPHDLLQTLFPKPLSELTAEAAERGRWEGELIHTRKDGREIVVASRWAAQRDGSGHLEGILEINRDITERKNFEKHLEHSLREKEVMLKEIHHRVKNNLQVIASLVDIQTNSLENPGLRGLFQNVRDRVRSMALVHEKLYQSESLARVELADYARSLLSYLCRAHGSPDTHVEIKLELQPVSVSVEMAVPCGLILNELVTNALKHAFSGRARGELTTTLRAGPDGRVCLRVSDNGVGLPAGMDWRQSPSLGLRLIHLLAGQLNAKVEVEVHAGRGTEFLISFEQSQAKQPEEKNNA